MGYALLSLKSMTGFARTSAELCGFHAGIEIKSVNGKGLDIRVRVPAMIDGFDLMVRKQAAARLGRGSVMIGISLDPLAGGEDLPLDEGRLDVLHQRLSAFAARKGLEPPPLAALIALPGILSSRPASLDEAQREALESALLRLLDRTLDALDETRRREGAALCDMLRSRIDEIEAAIADASALDALRPAAIRDRIARQIHELCENRALESERLEQEAALLAIRGDIREELDRLAQHCAEARRLLDAGKPVGRQLDFLAQEFNREANTLCSKSNDAALTRIGLAMKTAIDQFREQCLNVE